MEAKHTATQFESKRIAKAIAECDRYIQKEEKRAADIRPESAEKMLAFYKAHKAKLQGML